ncbi:MAG: alternative ribosome rescue aminoacyl-tRNA hydrolase ArfB [Acidimicrobiia bacterium]
MPDDLEITPDLAISPQHLEWRFSTAGGPGGQHANRSATRADLTVNLRAALPKDVAERLLERLGNRAKTGEVTVSVDETRSQSRNRQIARDRMADLLSSALHEPEPRRPTKPTKASKERRLRDKRHRSEVKDLRKPPPEGG